MPAGQDEKEPPADAYEYDEYDGDEYDLDEEVEDGDGPTFEASPCIQVSTIFDAPSHTRHHLRIMHLCEVACLVAGAGSRE